MNATKILNDDISDLKISSLPNSPTSQILFGGKGYSSQQMKAAFDNIPLIIIERLNALLDDISAAPADSISAVMQTGISDGHTLANLFEDLQNGNAAVYIKVDGKSLAAELIEIKEAIRALGGEI